MQNIDCTQVIANHKIIVSNINDGDTLSYSLALVKGHILPVNPSYSLLEKCKLSVVNHHENCNTSESVWSVVNSEFKVLVDLTCGKNNLTFQYCDASLKITINFKIRKSVFHVTPIYIICKNHDGRFQAPQNEDNSIQSACQRIAMGARLIQCLTAEKLYESDLGRKTFQLSSDILPDPGCVVFHSDMQVEQAQSMEPNELWEYLGRELMLSPLGSKQRKFMAFLSCTRYCADDKEHAPQTHQEMLERTDAYVALGGGGLALFGTACLHTWPSSVDEVQQRFLDETRVDTQYLMDDSCYRGTYGACFATTLGSVCHELGHTFDLGHSEDGIMGRGFDNVDLVFAFQPPNTTGSDDVNSNVISPENISQHSTITFTSILNISYTMASPIKRPRRKEQSLRLKHPIRTNHNQNSTKDHQITNMNGSLINYDDHTFWSNSCAVLLSFHRWFNDESQNQLIGELKYEPIRKLLTSKAGIRIVEIRDVTGLVVHYWEFLCNRGRQTFIVPTGVWYQPANTLVAEDSDGNIVKSSLSIQDLNSCL